MSARPAVSLTLSSGYVLSITEISHVLVNSMNRPSLIFALVIFTRHADTGMCSSDGKALGPNVLRDTMADLPASCKQPMCPKLSFHSFQLTRLTEQWLENRNQCSFSIS